MDPVVEGLARAKADILYKSDYDKILPILIHGDAAVVGQGVVYEVVQMSQLKATIQEELFTLLSIIKSDLPQILMMLVHQLLYCCS